VFAATTGCRGRITAGLHDAATVALAFVFGYALIGGRSAERVGVAEIGGRGHRGRPRGAVEPVAQRLVPGADPPAIARR
jgi:hypothetical protein